MANLPHKTVLIWPPSNEDLSELSRQLTFFGFDVHLVDDAGLFLDTLAGQTVHAAIYDGTHAVRLPEADKERMLALARQTPMVCIAPSGDLQSRLDAVRLGCRAYLQQPLNIGGLLDTLAHLRPPQRLHEGRVLVVDHVADSAQLHAGYLIQAGYATRVVNEVDRLLDTLEDSPAELVLMKMEMPAASAGELIQVIRQRDAWLCIPIILLAEGPDPALRHQAIAMGADALLEMPLQAEHLVSAVRSRIARHQALHGMMLHDSLSGLLTYKHFKERLRVEVSRSLRTGRPISLAMLDIDYARQASGKWGHQAGDRMTRNLSRLLQSRLRATDILGHPGGEEFTIVLPDTSMLQARLVVEEIRDSFSRLDHAVGDNMCWRSTLSVGLAHYPPHGDADALIQAADEALSSARRAGPNQVAVAEAAVE